MMDSIKGNKSSAQESSPFTTQPSLIPYKSTFQGRGGRVDGVAQNVFTDPNAGVSYLSAVENASTRTSSRVLFALLPENQRDNAHLSLCIKMASSQNHEAIVAAFKRIPEARRGMILEVLVPKLGLIGEISEDRFIEVVANFPEGEEREVCAALEQAIPSLQEIGDHENLICAIRLFTLLPRAQRDQCHLKICIELFFDATKERIPLAKASAEDIITAVSDVPLEERALFFKMVSLLTLEPERRVRANIIALFALLSADQRNEEHLEICHDLMKGSYPMEGKGIVNVVKSLSSSERASFLEASAAKLGSYQDAWFKKDVFTLFGSLPKEERNEVTLGQCITLLSGPAKYFERDLIIEAVKRLPESGRASFLNHSTPVLSRIEDLLLRAYAVEFSIERNLGLEDMDLLCKICPIIDDKYRTREILRTKFFCAREMSRV